MLSDYFHQQGYSVICLSLCSSLSRVLNPHLSLEALQTDGGGACSTGLCNTVGVIETLASYGKRTCYQ